MTPKQMVKDINSHCDRGNGIYVTWPETHSHKPRTIRCYGAKLFPGLREGTAHAYVTPDFETWALIVDGVTFSDGNWNAPIGKLPRQGDTVVAMIKDLP